MECINKMAERKSWDEYFIELAELVSTRATCNRLKVGAVLVADKRIISTGYNGVPSGVPHCTDENCNENNKCLRTIHAEQNAISQAARYGIKTEGTTIYVTHQPCRDCTKIIISAGIKEIVYKNSYIDELALEMINLSGIILKKI